MSSLYKGSSGYYVSGDNVIYAEMMSSNEYLLQTTNNYLIKSNISYYPFWNLKFSSSSFCKMNIINGNIWLYILDGSSQDYVGTMSTGGAVNSMLRISTSYYNSFSPSQMNSAFIAHGTKIALFQTGYNTGQVIIFNSSSSIDKSFTFTSSKIFPVLSANSDGTT